MGFLGFPWEAPGGAVLSQCGEEGGFPQTAWAMTNLGSPRSTFPHTLK